MKKSLIALAVAGAFVAPVAMADTANVNIYGQLNYSYDAISNGAIANSASANNVSSNVSRIGFKGSEDLGDGLSAVFQVEQGLNADTAALNASTVRDTFAGLSSTSMGTLIAGVHDTPYKMATRGYDLFADNVADNRSIMGVAGLHDARLGNVVAYISPAMSGFTVAVATAAGAEIPVANATKGSATSLAVLYKADQLSGSIAYQTITMGTAGTGTLAQGTWANGTAGGPLNGVAVAVNDKTNAFKLGGSYTMDAFTLNLVYEKVSFNRAGTDILNQANWYLAGKYNINANDAVKLAYTAAGKNNNLTAAQVANTDANQIAVGYDHSLSKRTSVYALYSKISNKGNPGVSNYFFSQATSAANANGGAGSTPSVFSLGMKHSF